MIKSELISRSPLRILEKSTHGGLGKGNIGVIAAAKGTGKTACLVHIATDQLFQDKHVIHISFADSPNHIAAWYEDIFHEVARRYRLEQALEVHDEIIHNRVIMNFKQSSLSVSEMESRISALIDKGGFKADTLVIDGFKFPQSSLEEVREIRRFCNEFGLEAWFSASTADTSSVKNVVEIPELASVVQEISVVVTLKTHNNHVRLELLKDHDAPVASDTHLMLDPRILLISEE